MLPDIQQISVGFSQLGLMAWPLALCVILLLAVCLERFVFLVQARGRQKRHYQQLANVLRQHRNASKTLRDEVVAVELQALQRRYFSGLGILRMIGMLAPVLGLLGTVLGIISAFRIIAAQTGPVSPNMIADGLWEAMLTTAVGLSVALPALLMAQVFRHYSNGLLESLCHALNKLSLSFDLEKQGENIDYATFKEKQAA